MLGRNILGQEALQDPNRRRECARSLAPVSGRGVLSHRKPKHDHFNERSVPFRKRSPCFGARDGAQVASPRVALSSARAESIRDENEEEGKEKTLRVFWKDEHTYREDSHDSKP